MEEPTGRERTPRMVLRWPEQVVDRSLAKDSEVLFAGAGRPYGKASVTGIDFDRREVTLRWGVGATRERGSAQCADPRPLLSPRGQGVGAEGSRATGAHARRSTGRRAASSLALLGARGTALHRRARARATVSSRDDLDSVLSTGLTISTRASSRFRALPGTGKTYSGSHIIHHLIASGKRVGVVAMSHHGDRQPDVGDVRRLRRGGGP